MARVHLFEDRERSKARGVLVSALVFAMLALAFLMSISQVEGKTADEQTKGLEGALRRAAISCYAIEGRYPPSVDYMIEHYGVYYDRDKYIVSYNPFASNIMPSFNVLIKGASAP